MNVTRSKRIGALPGGSVDAARLLADAGSVDVEQIPDLIGDLEKVKALLWARLTTEAPASAIRGDDQLLTIDQAAERLGVLPGWLKKRPDLPFRVVLSEGTVRYSAQGIAAYIRGRRSAG